MKFILNILGVAFAIVATIIVPENTHAVLSDEAHSARGAESEIPKERLPENWSDTDVFGLRSFAEPLVAEPRVDSKEERAAFSKAINDYLTAKQSERLEGFLRDRPESRWSAALEHNLGLLKYREGFFTVAMEYWQSAWNRAKDSKDPRCICSPARSQRTRASSIACSFVIPPLSQIGSFP